MEGRSRSSNIYTMGVPEGENLVQLKRVSFGNESVAHFPSAITDARTQMKTSEVLEK